MTHVNVEAQFGEFVIPADMVSPAQRKVLDQRFGDHRRRIAGARDSNGNLLAPINEKKAPEQIGQTLTPDQRSRMGAIIDNMSPPEIVNQIESNPKSPEVMQMLEDRLNLLENFATEKDRRAREQAEKDKGRDI